AATSFTHTGLTSGTTYNYRVCVADNVGNVASGASTSYTVAAGDTTAPVGTVGINSGAAYTGTTSVTLNMSASDAVGVTGYYMSNSATAPSAGAAGWTAVTPTTSLGGTSA